MDNPHFDITKLSLTELDVMAANTASMAATVKLRADMVKAEVARRYGESAKQALAQQGKDHGTTRLPLQDGFIAKADVKQEVKWDSDALMAIAQELPWERVQALFKIKFEMSETIYKGVSALSPELRAKIDAARTTIIKPPAITLVKEG